MRRRDIHPPWCAQGHVCSSDAPSGEHRSNPLIIDAPAGRLLASRIQTITGINRIEVRAVVDLPADEDEAQQAARRLVRAVHHLVARRPVCLCGGAR
jgi:hypothetical protein